MLLVTFLEHFILKHYLPCLLIIFFIRHHGHPYTSVVYPPRVPQTLETKTGRSYFMQVKLCSIQSIKAQLSRSIIASLDSKSYHSNWTDYVSIIFSTQSKNFHAPYFKYPMIQLFLQPLTNLQPVRWVIWWDMKKQNYFSCLGNKLGEKWRERVTEEKVNSLI